MALKFKTSFNEPFIIINEETGEELTITVVASTKTKVSVLFIAGQKYRLVRGCIKGKKRKTPVRKIMR